jgi:multidrug resistance protein
MESPGSSERIRTSKEHYYEVEAGNAHHPNTDLPEERALDSPPPPVTSPKDEESGSQPDSNVVWWDEPADQDPANPMNWSNRKKWANIGILSSVTFLTLVLSNRVLQPSLVVTDRQRHRPLASSMFAPGVPQVMSEFGATSNLLATFVVAVYVLGFAFGPLLLAPLSEMYGRVPVYNVCNVFFVVFTVLCAEAKSMGMLVAVRFFAGFAGVAVITCGGGTIADLMEPERRGGAIAIWSVGPILGPVVGPVAGGFLVQAKGWRWVFWVLTIAVSLSSPHYRLSSNSWL